MAAIIVTLGSSFIPFTGPVQGVGPTAALADYRHHHRHCTWEWHHHHRVQVCR